jgi:TM2 domain-containing membrane protein YozV
MQFIGKIIASAIIVGLITLVIEAIIYEREVSANIRKEKPFYE